MATAIAAVVVIAKAAVTVVVTGRSASVFATVGLLEKGGCGCRPLNWFSADFQQHWYTLLGGSGELSKYT